MSKRPMSEIGRMLECDVPPVMPVLPLMSTVVFPLGVTSIQIRLEQSKALLKDHAEPDELIALVRFDRFIQQPNCGLLFVINRDLPYIFDSDDGASTRIPFLLMIGVCGVKSELCFLIRALCFEACR